MRLLMLLCFLCLPDPAEARGLPMGRIEDLYLVSETTLRSPRGEELALCHRSMRYHVLLLGVWRQSLGYSLAPNRCDSHRHDPLPASRVERLRDQSALARDVPVAARFSTTELATGFGWWPLGLILALAIWRRQRQG